MTKTATQIRPLLMAVWLLSCARVTSPDASSSSHWLHCAKLADCAPAPSAVACEQGYCVDAKGQRVALTESDAGVQPAADGGSPQAVTGDAGVAGDSAAICAAFGSPDVSAEQLSSMLRNAGGRCTLSASDYDQSCSQDSDCALVGVGDLCDLPCLVLCPNTAINVGAQEQYNADFAKTPLGPCSQAFCGCPCIGLPRCHNGQCEFRSCGAPDDAGL